LIDIYNLSVRRLALLLHIYQPPTQHENVFRDIADSCYLPLIRIIKDKKIKVTLDVPLGLLEQMEKYGYIKFLEDLRELVRAKRVELAGSGAYHPLFPRISTEFAQKQIILNEYALGYYFGKKGGFEGDPSIMIQNLSGFFPPGLAIDEPLLTLINDLGYEWVLTDEMAIPKEVGEVRHGVFKVTGFDIRLVARNRLLSELLINKRGLEVKDFIEVLAKSSSSVVALSGEVFGYHNDQGIFLFRSLLDALRKEHIELITVSEYVEIKDEREIQTFQESTWNTSLELTDPEHLYSMWEDKKNTIQKLLWEVLNKVTVSYKSSSPKDTLLGLEEIPLWNLTELEKLEDSDLRDSLELDLLVLKSMDSNQFLEASYNPIHSPGLILNAISLLAIIVSKIGSASLTEYAVSRLEEINELVKNSSK